MISILFVCTGNRYRSPIAAAFFLKCLGGTEPPDIWDVGSAGTWTEVGLPPHPIAVRDAKQLGLDIKSHRSRLVNLNLLSQCNLVLVMEAGQKEALHIEYPALKNKIHLLSEITDGTLYNIPDPFGEQDVSTIEIARELCNMIERGFDNICELAQHIQVSSTTR